MVLAPHLLLFKRKKGEDDADLHAAKNIIHSKHYTVSRIIEVEYDFGDTP
jgi:hypothetical protein